MSENSKKQTLWSDFMTKMKDFFKKMKKKMK